MFKIIYCDSISCKKKDEISAGLIFLKELETRCKGNLFICIHKYCNIHIHLFGKGNAYFKSRRKRGVI